MNLIALLDSYTDDQEALHAVKTLLGQMASLPRDHYQACLNIRTLDGLSPLHLCAVKNMPAVARLLLEHGASAQLRDTLDLTALHLAAAFGYKEIAVSLLAYGANMEAADNEGQTPLRYAVLSGQCEMVGWLIAEGAYCHSPSPPPSRAQGWLTHMASSLRDTWHFVRYHLAPRWHREPETFREHPMMDAAWLGHLDIIKLLAGHGVPLELRDRCGRTIMHYAVQHDHTAMVDYLAKVSIELMTVPTCPMLGKTPMEMAHPALQARMRTLWDWHYNTPAQSAMQRLAQGGTIPLEAHAQEHRPPSSRGWIENFLAIISGHGFLGHTPLSGSKRVRQWHTEQRTEQEQHAQRTESAYNLTLTVHAPTKEAKPTEQHSSLK